MTKRASIGTPILFLLLFGVCVIIAAIVLPLLAFIGIPLSVLLFGPPNSHTTPENYVRWVISNREDVDEDAVRIVHIEALQTPDSLWAVLANTGENSVDAPIHLLAVEDLGGSMGTYIAYYDYKLSDAFFDAEVRRYRNESGVQFSIHGSIFDDEISRIVVSWGDEWQKPAVIKENTFLLFSEWPSTDFTLLDFQITGFNDAGEEISTLLFQESLQ